MGAAAGVGRGRWLSRIVLAIVLASLFSDACYELIIPLLPAVLAWIGAGVAALGLIEGLAGGLASLFSVWQAQWLLRSAAAGCARGWSAYPSCGDRHPTLRGRRFFEPCPNSKRNAVR